MPAIKNRILAWPGLPVLLAFVLAAVSHWKIFENDVFWQCRAGEEILKTWHLQHQDTWSSTALGREWHNFQWLSTVVFSFVKWIGAQYFFLPTLRAGLIFLVLLGVTKIIRLSCQARKSAASVTLILLPIVYAIIGGRLHLRPDIFGAVLFTGMMLLFLREKPSTFSRALTLLLLWLWAGFHGGTAPIGVGVAVAAFAFGPLAGKLSLQRRAVWCIAACTTWFLTPNGTNLIGVVLGITTRYDSKWIGNPDHSPFLLSLLNPLNGGFTFIFLVAGAVAAFFAAFRKGPKTPKTFSNLAFLGICLSFLVVLTLLRLRVRLYAFLFFIPLLVPLLEELPKRLRAPVAKIWVPVAIGALGWFTAINNAAMTGVWGFGVDAAQFPVKTAPFIRSVPVSHRFFNAYDFGGYVVDQLRDFPVAQDGREVLYEDMFKELYPVKDNPAILEEFFLRHGFETLLVRAPKLSWLVYGADLHAPYYPKSEWAVVFFDEASMLYLKRVPENQQTIERFEYHVLSRSQIPEATWRFLKSDEARQTFRTEVSRCLSDQPENRFCRTAARAVR